MSQRSKELVFVVVSRWKRSSGEEKAGYFVVFLISSFTLYFAGWLSYDLLMDQASAAAQ